MITSVSQLPLIDYPFFAEIYPLVTEAHKEQKRKTGIPYQVHIDAVIVNTYNAVFNPELPLSCNSVDRLISLAAAHDVIEDQPDKVTYEQLYAIADKHLGPLQATHWLNSLKLLTKDSQDADYADYIVNLADDPFAAVVKLADLEHNSSDLPFGEKRSKYRLAKAYIELRQSNETNKDPDDL